MTTRFAILAGVSAIALSATLSAYALAANQARAWMGSARTIHLTRKTAAGIVAGAAIAIIAH